MDISNGGATRAFEACILPASRSIPKGTRRLRRLSRVIDRSEEWNASSCLRGNTPRLFWSRRRRACRFKGKKAASSTTHSRFLVGWRHCPAWPSPRVPALAGVVDCAVTGSLSGTRGWAEVTNIDYPMSLGWSINVLAVNLDSWKRLDPKTQAFLLEQFKAYEDKMWATIKTTTGEAENCNTGKQPCTMGKLAKTTIVPVKPEEAETHKKLVEGAVLAGWAKRCGACATNGTYTVSIAGLRLRPVAGGGPAADGQDMGFAASPWGLCSGVSFVAAG